MLAAGLLAVAGLGFVGVSRVGREQVVPGFERLAGRLRTTAAAYDDAANTAQRRSQAGSLGVAGAAMALCVALLWRVERVRARQRAAEARAGEERGRLVNKILSVAERQRSGVAAELHDGPIQGLTRLGIALERAGLRLRRGQAEDGLRLLADAQTALGDEVQALRRIMATLRPPVLEERGLVSALCDYVEVVREQAGINCTLTAKLPERLPEDHEIVLYRVAQEALTNVARHARASCAPGRADRDRRGGGAGGARRRDRVRPGGRAAGRARPLRLAGMRERVELAGGTWTVWSRLGSGTVLTASLPKAVVTV
jgi:signal transduction histidine kinase